MSFEGLVLSVSLGYISGLLFFYHLFTSVSRAIGKRKGNLYFWRRFIPFGVFASLCAYYMKDNFLFFPLGFYLSRLTASFIVLRMRSVWRLRKEP